MFKAEVSYPKGSLGTENNPVTKSRLERMLLKASVELAPRDCIIVTRNIETPEDEKNDNVGKVDLLFIVPDTPNRRELLFEAIKEFEDVVLRDYTRFLDPTLREVEPEQIAEETRSMPGGEPEYVVYPIPGLH